MDKTTICEQMMFSLAGLKAKSLTQELLGILDNPRFACLRSMDIKLFLKRIKKLNEHLAAARELANLIVGDLAGRESPAVLSA